MTINEYKDVLSKETVQGIIGGTYDGQQTQRYI